MMTQKDVQLIGEMKSDIKNVCKDVSLIMNNHLPHIQERLDKLFYWIIGLLASQLLATLGLLFTIALT